jgi:coproporphyrinogen III oxidase-like Fe-S oxidoreductase
MFKHQLVTQMHWGGGTPTFLNKQQISMVFSPITHIDLICHFELDCGSIESQWDLNFETYFKEDLELLQTFINDKLV